MSSPLYFPGSVLATKSGESDIYVTQEEFDTVWTHLGWTSGGQGPVGDAGILERASMTSEYYGASWGMGYGLSAGTVDDFHTLVRDWWGLGTFTTHADPSDNSNLVCRRVCGNVTTELGANEHWWHGDETTAIVFLQTGVGLDASFYDSQGDPLASLNAYHNLVTMLSRMNCGPVTQINAALGTESGTWGTTSTNGTNYSGGNARYTTQEGAWKEWDIDGDAVDITTFTYDGVDIRGRILEISVDGQPYDSYQLDAQGGPDGGGWDASYFTVHLRGLGAGTHTVRCTAGTGVSGAFIALDCYAYPRAAAEVPIIPTIKEPWLPGIPGAFGGPATEADYEVIMGSGGPFDDAIETVRLVHPQSRIVVVDLAGLGDFLVSDDIHPDQDGHIEIARRLQRAVLAEGPSRLAA